MKTSQVGFLLCVALATALCSSAHAQFRTVSLDSLAWLAGCWEQVDAGVKSEEQWMKPAGGSMLGISRTVKGEETLFYEFLQIRRAGDTIVYIARPSGQLEASFTLVHYASGEAVFENMQHDFPQRIIYQREPGGSLHARIEGKEKGKLRSEDYPMRKASCN